jgi:hypothetical protein
MMWRYFQYEQFRVQPGELWNPAIVRREQSARRRPIWVVHSAFRIAARDLGGG